MSDHSNRPCCWVGNTLAAAYPESAGVTLAAIDALASSDSYNRAQLAYAMNLAFRLGASARMEADVAELRAWQQTRPTGGHWTIVRPHGTAYLTRRRAARMDATDRQNEYFWLRTRRPTGWDGGTAEQASARFMWEADRPDVQPPAVSTRARRTRAGLAWADDEGRSR